MLETKDELAVGVASAFHILDTWKLTAAEMRGVLGFPFGTQLAEWRAGDLTSMPVDVVTRLRHVGGIYKMLRKYPVAEDFWLRQPLAQFGEQTPLARMSSGDMVDLVAVHDYLKTHYGMGRPRAFLGH